MKFDYFHTLFHNSRVNAILQMETTGHIIRVNDAFTNYFGYSDEDLAGKYFGVLFTEADHLRRKPEMELASVLATGQGTDKNYMVHRNGEITWVSGESVLIENNDGGKVILKIIQDINQQKESELSLSVSNEFNESILTSIEDGVAVLDQEMTIHKFNPAFGWLFPQYLPSIGANFTELIKTVDAAGEWLKKIGEVFATGKSFYRQELSITNGGEKRVYHTSCQALPTRGANGLSVLLVAHDITAEKKAETEREDIMGFVAHELRNPLATIVMSNEIIQGKLKEHISPDIEKVLERSRQNVLRLNKMISQLYDTAKAGSGNFVLETSVFDFDGMVAEAIDTATLTAPGFTITTEGKTGISIKGDRHRLVQVLTNYIGNAVKYSPQHKIITVSVQLANNEITVAVKDRGRGIPAAQLPFVFERFYRAEKTGRTEGIGLGLYLCERIINLHGGKVWAESEDGKGSIFFFSIPVNGLPDN